MTPLRLMPVFTQRHRIQFLLVMIPALAFTGIGAQQAPIQGEGASFSPDGARIAFVANRGSGKQLFVARADGSQEVQITDGEGPRGRPRWSVDGQTLEVQTFARDTTRIYAIALANKSVTLIATIPGRNPVLLPDGQRALFARGSWTAMALYVGNRDGSEVRQLAGGNGAIWNHVLSPDGKQIAYTHSVANAPLSVWVMNADGTNARQVTHFSAADGAPQIPDWSPDGRRLAVQAAIASPRDTARQIGHVWIVDVATGRATKLAPHDEPYVDEVPRWVADGKRIAFQSDRTGKMQIWIMNADGTGARQVTR